MYPCHHLNKEFSHERHDSAQHSTAQHSTAQHSTAQHSRHSRRLLDRCLAGSLGLALVAFGSGITLPTPARATTTLPPVIVVGTPIGCPPGQLPANTFSGCAPIPGGGFDGGNGGCCGGGIGGVGPGGAPPSDPPHKEVKQKAKDTCTHGARAVINSHADSAFMVCWTLHYKGKISGLVPNGDIYKITFEDGSYKYYRWTKAPGEVPLSEYDAQCHGG